MPKINVFFSYSHKDEQLRDELANHLSILRREGWIDTWHDRRISAGMEWEGQIDEHLKRAQIILLLISPDFLASDYCYDVELKVALERHETGACRVIPIILRPVDWRGELLGKLQALPKDATPITRWPDRDEAFQDVAKGIRNIVEGLRHSSRTMEPSTPFIKSPANNQQHITQPGVLRYLLDRHTPNIHRLLTKLGILSVPPEQDLFNSYLREFRAKIENNIQQKTYIPPVGKEVPAAVFPDEVSKDPFVKPVHSIIRQIIGPAQGGDTASAQIAAVNRRSRVVQNMLKTLLSTDDPLVLLGDPGTGKTMTLQQAAIALADLEINRQFPIITLYIRLGEFRVEGEVGPEAVMDYVKQSSPPSLRPYVDMLDRAGHRLVIFFDGMDEMSRDRYNQHTEALSLFASSRKGVTKTLFSCRIADFSPKFIHQRLVLLPFNQAQISEYLKKYIVSFPILIDGEPWSLKSLARRLAHDVLPMEANNPFVLWLLCYQLQKKASWPSSRVELLAFYNEQNYARIAEAVPKHEFPFPEREQAFLEWGRFAYMITLSNRGAAIPARMLCDNDGHSIDQVKNLIHAGKRCGILVESIDGYEHLIRFQHHRFQEYFTALYIHTADLEISWLDKLDAPRWQETMLNLILMGGAEDTAQALAEGIEAPLRYLKYIDGTFTTDLPDHAVVGNSLEEQETIIADRIELASRVLRQIGSDFAPIRMTLMPPVQEAIGFLVEKGNPITQVKMMRSCQNVPDIDFIDIVQKPLKSPIQWVRNQALILVASDQRRTGTSGANLATEIGYDLANGILTPRLLVYTKVIRGTRSIRAWWYLALALFCYVANVLLLLGMTALMYAGMLTLAASEHAAFLRIDALPRWLRLDNPLLTLVYALAIIVAMLHSFKSNPAQLWKAILGTAGGGLALLTVVYITWRFGLFGLVASPFVLLSTFIAVFPIAIAITSLSHFLMLTAFLAGAGLMKGSSNAIKSFFQASWRNCGFADAMRTSVAFLAGAIGSVVIWPIMFIPIELVRFTSSFPFPSNPPANVAIIGITFVITTICVAMLTRALVVQLPSRIENTFINFFRSVKSRTYIKGSAIIGIVLYIYGVLIVWKFDWLPPFINVYVTRGGVVIIVLLIVLSFLRNLSTLPLELIKLIRGHREPFAPGTIKALEWEERIREAGAVQQSDLLIRTNHQTLALNPEQFLDVLKNVQLYIREEPALSTYWAQRDQLEQVLRQEKQG
jgi:Cdc6-like AAA superfamily ATPase